MIDLYIDAQKIQFLLLADVNMLQIMLIINIVIDSVVILVYWNSVLLTICTDFFFPGTIIEHSDSFPMLVINIQTLFCI
jgi:hypothetical protein